MSDCSFVPSLKVHLFFVLNGMQFLSHPALGDLLSEKDQEVYKLLTMKDVKI